MARGRGKIVTDNPPFKPRRRTLGAGMDNTIPHALLAIIAGSVLSAASAMMMGEGQVLISPDQPDNQPDNWPDMAC